MAHGRRIGFDGAFWPITPRSTCAGIQDPSAINGNDTLSRKHKHAPNCEAFLAIARARTRFPA